MGNNLINIPWEELKQFARDCFFHMGFSRDDSDAIGDNLAEADLRGLNTHGILRVLMYLKRVKAGVLDPKAVPEEVLATPAYSIWDAHNGMGVLASIKAVDMAISKAKETGIHLSGVRNSNHFGTAAYYTMRATRQDMIGFSCSNTEALMPAPGGAQKSVGNNPFSVAFPGGKYPDVVLDMAVSAAAIGKIVLADKKGLTIPNGWATDAEGKETNDAKEALKGFLLPVGGPKGYGLSLAIDILAGVLTGASFGSAVRCPFHDFTGPQGLGHLFIAIDIEKFLPYREYEQRIESLIEQIKRSKKSPETAEIYLPGEIEHRKKQEQMKNGVQFPVDVLKELLDFARTLGLENNVLQRYGQ